jgi:hypothetical protein
LQVDCFQFISGWVEPLTGLVLTTLRFRSNFIKDKTKETQTK